MKNRKFLFLLTLFLLLLYCIGCISAVSNDTEDSVVSEINDKEFISLSDVEQIDECESVLSSEDNMVDSDENDLISTNDNSNFDIVSRDADGYLEDIKGSTSDEFYNFVNYMITDNGFKFDVKSNDEGYNIYSSLDYKCKLYDGSDYVLTAGNSYFISKNRIDYVINEYYPDVLYAQDDDIYLDELYLGWLKWVEDYHISLNTYGTDTSISVNMVQSSSQSSSLGLPSSFDLRNVNGNKYVTSVKDQANASTCWAFASIAALESFLLKHEGKSYDFSSKYDFSENNLKNVMSSIGKQGIYTRSPIDGGNDNIALAYFIRWSGPILEKYDKYDLINNLNPINNVPIEFFNSEKHVQGVKYIHKRNNALDNNEIKQALINYGGLATSMWWINNYEINGNYYYNGLANEVDKNNKPLNFGHAVCIIGWDDNYSAENFHNSKLNIKPEGNGAFIIKNSWGDDVGKNGYYYVSYYDTQLARRTSTDLNHGVGITFTSVENKTNYGKNYNYNPQGVTFWIGMNDVNNNPAKSLTYYSQWIATADENLKACGIYVNDECRCNINVFIDDNPNPKETKSQVLLGYAGFHTINFTNLVPVKKGQKFRIEITIISNTPVKLPAELSYTDFNANLSKIYYNAHANADETGFISGGKLVDIAKIYKSCNLCINVYTEFKELLEVKIEVIQLSVSSDLLLNEVTVKLLDSDNTILGNFELISCRGSDYQIVKTNDNGEAIFVANEGIGDYLCIYYLGNEKYEYAFTALEINMAPKTNNPIEIQPTTTQPTTSQPTVNLPVSGSNTNIPVNPILLTVKVQSGKPAYNAKISVSLNKNINLKSKVTGNGKTLTINFKKGKSTLELSKFKLKKGKKYKFKFSGANSNYKLGQTVSITTKK